MAEEGFESVKATQELVGRARNEGQLLELQEKKLAIRDQLVAARAEMRQLDAELIKNGANGLDLVLVCW